MRIVDHRITWGCILSLALLALILIPSAVSARTPCTQNWTVTVWDDSSRMVSIQVLEENICSGAHRANVVITMVDVMGNRFERSKRFDKLWYEKQEHGGTLWMGDAFIRMAEDHYTFHAHIKDMSATITVQREFPSRVPLRDDMPSILRNAGSSLELLVPRGSAEGYLIKDSVPYALSGIGMVDRMAFDDFSAISDIESVRIITINRQNSVIIYGVMGGETDAQQAPLMFGWAGGVINPPIMATDIRMQKFEYNTSTAVPQAELVLLCPRHVISITSTGHGEGPTSEGMTMISRQPLGAPMQNIGFGRFTLTAPQVVVK